jgi:hypothetical protein
MNRIFIAVMAAIATTGGLAYAASAYAEQTHRASNHETVQARGGKGGDKGGGHYPKKNHPNQPRIGGGVGGGGEFD